MTSLPPRRPPVWQLLLGIAISAVLLYAALRGIQFSEVLAHVRTARLLPMVVAIILATCTFVVRIFRWQLLLRGDDGRRLHAAPLWHAIAMGFMANNVLPLRVGELVRILAAARLTDTRFTAVLASIAVERLFDAITVVGLLALGLFTTTLPAGGLSTKMANIATYGGVAALAGLLVAGLVVAFPLAAERVIRAVVPPGRLATRLVGLIEGVRQGLWVLSSPVKVIGAVLWSLTLWGISALSFYVMFAAFGIEVNFSGTLLMQGLIMFGISLPSTPGYVGAFEFPIIEILTLYGADRNLAAAYALTYHVTTFLPITLLGAWSVVRTNLGLTALRRNEP
ncbi:MAG TPA: lysylphosphatidylglycerol synthase transmembrane domain-containing protein [Gemmatimonadales bacterium]